MRRLIIFLLVFSALASCSKNETPPPPAPIPTFITGVVREINVTPIDITTPNVGSFLISMNNTLYKVEFNATAEAQANALLLFESDTILTQDSREFSNRGKDAIAYNPLGDNAIMMIFDDGRKINGTFDVNTSFGGVFGEALIAQWRDPSDPSKPNQKAKDDITNFVQRYADKDGPGSETAPVYLFGKVSRN